MRILTPTAAFPDPAVARAAAACGLTLTEDTTGRGDVIREQRFTAPDGSVLRYLFEPELEIPVILLEGAGAGALRARLAGTLPQVEPLAAAIGYDPAAGIDVRLTLLRILAAHALEEVSEPMVRVAALAARDPSPFIRLAAVQLLQYGHEATLAGIVRGTLVEDPDPDVRDFARAALDRFDAAPPPAGRR